jgi:hypothetical protein
MQTIAIIIKNATGIAFFLSRQLDNAMTATYTQKTKQLH